MSEVLSQNEIDALLSALNSGEIYVQEIKEEKEERRKKGKRENASGGRGG